MGSQNKKGKEKKQKREKELFEAKSLAVHDGIPEQFQELLSVRVAVQAERVETSPRNWIS